MDQRSADTISQLLLQQLRTDLSETEEDQLNAWIGSNSERMEMVSRLNDPAQLQTLMQDYVRRHAQMDAQFRAAVRN